MGESVNFVRSILTIVGLVCFLGIVFWAYSKGSKSRFEDAANLPFADDERDQRTMQETMTNEVDTRSGSKQ